MGRVSPQHPTIGIWRGRRISSPSGIRGGAPAANGFYAVIFEVTKKPLNTLFSIFKRWRPPPPPTLRGPEKLFPLSTGLLRGKTVGRMNARVAKQPRIVSADGALHHRGIPASSL